jgi:hypothetical protein
MSANDIGNAGEHLVCARLLLAGFRVYVAPRGQSCFDLVAEWPATGRLNRIRVKCGGDGSIKWNAKKDAAVLPDLDRERADDFSVCVDARDADRPIFYVVPSVVVEDKLNEGYRHAQQLGRLDGKPWKPHRFRMIRWDGNDKPRDICFGFAEKWSGYRDAFDQLKGVDVRLARAA